MNVLLLLAAGVALLVLPFAVGWLVLPRAEHCPCCEGETLPVQPPHARVLGRWVVLRWCVRCGWEGYARRIRARPQVSAEGETRPETTRGRGLEGGS